MELEENMYVRTRYGYIAKLKNINKTDRYTEYEFDNKIGYDCDGFFHLIVEDCIDDIEMIKASHNIIDLIEVGDYVNGYKVIEIIEDNRKLEPSTMVWCNYGSNGIGFYNEDIKSIVTKEIFSNAEYRVETN